MDRKLRHLSIGFPAIAAGLALSMLVVLAARPASGSGHDIGLAAAAGAGAVAASALNAALQQAAPEAGLPDLSAQPSSRPARNATRRRQSLLMPYFSFASRD